MSFYRGDIVADDAGCQYTVVEINDDATVDLFLNHTIDTLDEEDIVIEANINDLHLVSRPLSVRTREMFNRLIGRRQ